MWNRTQDKIGGTTRFFRISFRYDTLMSFIRQNFDLTQYHKYTHQDLYDMIPWERHIQISLVEKYVEEKNLENQKLAEQQKNDQIRLQSSLKKLVGK